MTKKTATNLSLSFSAISDESVSVDSDAHETINAYAAKSSSFIILLVLQTSFFNEVFLCGLKAEMWKHKAAVCLWDQECLVSRASRNIIHSVH